ncbi:MAG: hypothetical protein ACRD0P_04250, partial [Stackebrandtia sp.]
SKSTPANAIGAGFAVAVTAALAQLGLMSGLAILIWREGSATEWAAHLSWGAWLAAVATVAGGLVAGRLTSETGARVTSVLAAGIGGFIIAPLIAVPAMRFDDTDIATAPFAAVGIGVLAGMVLTGVSLAWRAISINVLATIGLTWVLALLAAFVPTTDDSGIVKLAVWSEWTGLSVPVVPALLAGSLLIGMVTAWIMTSENSVGDHRITAISGAVGPLLLVAGYAAAGQGDVRVDPQWPGIWIGVGAVVAGLLGTLLVTALRRGPAPAPSPATTAAPVTATAAVEAASLGDPLVEDHPTAAMPEMPRGDQTYEVPAAPPPPPAPESVDPYVSSEYDEGNFAHYTPPSSGVGRADTRGTEFDVGEPTPPPAPEPEPEPAPVTKDKPAKKSAKKSKKAAKPSPTPEPESEDGLFPASEDDKTKAMPSQDENDSWYSELRDDNAFINDKNEQSEPEPEAAPEKKRRWGRKKKDN